MEQWNSHGGTLWWNSRTLMGNSVLKQWNSNCGLNSGTVMVENSHGGKVRWKSGTVMVEQCGGTVKQSWWNSVVVQSNIDGEQCA